MNSDLDLAIQAARLAGEFLRQQFHQSHFISMKSATELVTEVDGQVERMIADILRQGNPTYGFFGEESNQQELHPQTEAFWVVDPIDGTTNFVHGISVFAISIGLVVNGESVLGVIYQPILDELFAAQKGQGATLNGQLIHVSRTREIRQAYLGSGFSYHVWQSEQDNVAQWGRVVKKAFGVLSSGVATLGLCEVAAGRLDGYWELDLFSWDIAAGAVLVSEAGGRVCTAMGEKFNPLGHSIIADNGLIHEELLELVRGER